MLVTFTIRFFNLKSAINGCGFKNDDVDTQLADDIRRESWVMTLCFKIHGSELIFYWAALSALWKIAIFIKKRPPGLNFEYAKFFKNSIEKNRKMLESVKLFSGPNTRNFLKKGMF